MPPCDPQPRCPPTARPLSRQLVAALICTLATIPLARAASPQAPYTAAPYKAAPYKAAPYHPPINHHLHGMAETHPHRWVRTRWAHHWNAYAWFALHRGTGTVEGIVHGGSGSPMVGASVRLRHANGHALRHASARHITSTGSGGTFVMKHVRAGRYRVRADAQGHSGHTPIVVHAGQVVEVGVKL